MPYVTITLKGASHLTHDEEESARDMIVDYLRLMEIKGVVIDDTSTRFQLDLSQVMGAAIDAGEIVLPAHLPSEVGGRIFEHRQLFGSQVMPRMEAIAESIVAQIRDKEILREMQSETMWEYGDDPWELLHDDHVYVGDDGKLVGIVEWPVDGQLLVHAHNVLVAKPPAPEESPDMSA